MDYIVDHKPSITGVVLELSDEYIWIQTETVESQGIKEAKIRVPFDAEDEFCSGNYLAGDEVQVFFDGNISGDPPTVKKVYAIFLVQSAEDDESE